jgi:formylglycine-generating enzyme required for sulfatase activity
MVYVPAGWFVMGSETGPPASRPAHRVYVSAFAIADTEVTNEQFREYVEESGTVPLAWKGGLPTLNAAQPVTGILWEEAAAFCEWYGWRLPTEAEWEKAARGLDQRTYPWGDV